MTAKTISNGLLRTIAILTGIVALVWFFIQIQTIIVYIIISAVLALISRPGIQFLTQKLKLNNTLAVLISIIVYSIFTFLIFNAFTPLISKQSENIALLNSDEFKSNIERLSTEVNDYLLFHNIDILEKTKNIDFLPSLKNIPNILNVILSKIGSFSMGLFSVLFISFFFMLDAKILSRGTYAFIPKEHVFHAARSLETIKDLLSRYFIGLIIQISVLFAIYSIVLSVFSIENAIIIAFLCALFNLIPYIGPLIGGIVMFVLATTNNLDLDFQTQILPNTLYIMGGYFAAQLIDNFVSQPLIFSKSVKSHPLEIFLVIMIFGSLFGIIGMVVSIPAYTAIKVIAKEFFNKYKAVKLLTKDF
ncbi:putative PurR-regulated permease PerM [Wenyingzhuangia heitensis]|uniref:PurR-regulated permease PerM n=1 Tax=Wenyingzhuangia heitensis TaxID=1487859 RepID=A0ABX0U7T5_9FLAO|nr:AI-2E family transporter [Wenyingzhuangia heitensis]NIJ44223.1 putative PurR-regulated permease PerM [Wenyingzhuangia heitensis]